MLTGAMRCCLHFAFGLFRSFLHNVVTRRQYLVAVLSIGCVDLEDHVAIGRRSSSVVTAVKLCLVALHLTPMTE